MWNDIAFECCRTPSARPHVGGSGRGMKSQRSRRRAPRNRSGVSAREFLPSVCPNGVAALEWLGSWSMRAMAEKSWGRWSCRRTRRNRIGEGRGRAREVPAAVARDVWCRCSGEQQGGAGATGRQWWSQALGEGLRWGETSAAREAGEERWCGTGVGDGSCTCREREVEDEREIRMCPYSDS